MSWNPNIGAIASSRRVLASVGDDYYDMVTLLVPFDDASVQDRSRGAYAMQAYGEVLVTSPAPVGAYAAYMNSSAYGSSGGTGYIKCTESAFLGGFFGARDFTVEAYVYRPADWNMWYHSVVGDFYGTYSGSWSLFISDSTGGYTAKFVVVGSPGVTLSSTTPIPLAQWTHVAVSRQGTRLMMFINGSLDAEATITATLSIGGGMVFRYPFFIGGNNVGSTDYLKGGVDSVRITKGTARYSSSFSVPSAGMPEFGPAYIPSAPPTATPFSGLSDITPVAGWGTIRRNPAYVGPALRVANSGTSEEQDVAFDANGYLTGTIPYGANTRVVRVYDQWGTDDMVAAKTDGIKVMWDHTTQNTWHLSAVGNGAGLNSTRSVGGDPAPAWNIQQGVWCLGISRWDNRDLYRIFGVPRNSNYMSIGLWAENDHLHWRINGSAGVNYASTYTGANNDVCGGDHLERVIGDMSTAGTGYGYHNGVSRSTLGYTAPITYDAGAKMSMFGGPSVGTRHIGTISELHVFSSSGALSAGTRTVLDAALAQAKR